MPGRSRPASAGVAVEHDLHRNALHDLGEVAGGVVRRQQRELLAAGRRDAVDHGRARSWPGKVSTVDVDRLARPHVGKLGLLVVGDDVDRAQRHDRHQLRAGLDVLPDPQRPRADRAILGRDDRRVAEVESRLLLDRACMLQRRLGLGLRAVCSTATCWRALASAARACCRSAARCSSSDWVCCACCTLPAPVCARSL